MLQNTEELDQFRITVQHLESCRDLILEGGEARCRAALILLDHVSEVILYRIINQEYERDDMFRKVIPEKYPPKLRSQIKHSYHSKLEVVTNTHKLPIIVSKTLTVLHDYRNATYHRDKHNLVVLPIFARIALVATADLFARTAAGFGNRGIGGNDDVEWLQRYGLTDSLIWFETVARAIAKDLKRGVRPRLATVKEAFVTDVQTRLEAIRKILAELFSSVGSEEIDRMLKRYEFRRQRPELESRLSQKFRSLNYEIAAGHGDEVTLEEYEAAETEFRTAYERQFEKFNATCRHRDLECIGDQLESLRNEENFRSALIRYSTLDKQLTSFEQSTYRCYVEMEWAAEMQADIARGK
jgi:hypothetical protein